MLAAAVAALVSRVGGWFAFCTVAAPFGWLVAGIAALTIAGVSIALLGSVRKPDLADEPELRSSACAACGSHINEDWRLCPYCGALLECDVRLPLSGRIAEGSET